MLFNLDSFSVGFHSVDLLLEGKSVLTITFGGWWLQMRLVATFVALNVASSISVLEVLPETKLLRCVYDKEMVIGAKQFMGCWWF